MAMNDDFAEIRAAQAGDSQAFRRLLETHYEPIYRHAFAKTGSQCDAQDITQETCIRLADGLAGFRFDSTFRTWLYRLTANAIIDWQRRQERHRSGRAPETALIEIRDPRPDPETNAENRGMLRGIGGLPNAIKDAVILVHVHGLTHKEAAQTLRCAETTISWRLFRARRILARDFQAEFAS